MFLAALRSRSWTAPHSERASTYTAWFSRMIFVESLWWKSRRESVTQACARATRTRAFSLFAEPFCLRDRSRCAFFSFFSARRRNLGALIFIPSSSTAKQASPRWMPHSRSISGSGDGVTSTRKTRRSGPRHPGPPSPTTGRGGRRELARPADFHVPDLREPKPPAVQHLEPRVGREPARLTAVLAGPEPGRADFRALPFPGDRREEVPVRLVQVAKGLLEHHRGHFAEPCSPGCLLGGRE
jgi:hypothetical protein